MWRLNREKLAHDITIMKEQDSKSYADLSRLCNISAATICRIANETVTPSLEHIVRLAECIGRDPIEYLSDNDYVNLKRLSKEKRRIIKVVLKG